jgi:hypothetical protein
MKRYVRRYRFASFRIWPRKPWRKFLGTYWIESWVSHREDVDAMAKRKYLSLPGNELRLSRL